MVTSVARRRRLDAQIGSLRVGGSLERHSDRLALARARSSLYLLRHTVARVRRRISAHIKFGGSVVGVGIVSRGAPVSIASEHEPSK